MILEWAILQFGRFYILGDSGVGDSGVGVSGVGDSGVGDFAPPPLRDVLYG